MIDLYTVKGEKIENPLRLSNGAAYVAVKPRDSFVDTGYEKYLVKASRYEYWNQCLLLKQ